MRARSDKHCGFALPRGFIECRTPECEITSPITRVPFYRHLVWKACLIIRKAIDSVNYRKDSDRAQSMTLVLVETTLSDLKISTHTFFIILFINPRTSFVGSSTRRQPS